MPNNNNQPTLLMCTTCNKRLTCPWSEFSNNIRQKYCPVLAQKVKVITPEEAKADLRRDLATFIAERLN